MTGHPSISKKARGAIPIGSIVGFGAFIAWMLQLLSPMHAIGVAQLWDLFYVPVRIAFYVSLIVGSLIVIVIARFSIEQLRSIAMSRAFFISAILVHFAMGFAGWIFDLAGNTAASRIFVWASFIMSGLMLPYLQIMWSRGLLMFGQDRDDPHAIPMRVIVPALVVGSVFYLLSVLIEDTVLSRITMSALALFSLVLAVDGSDTHTTARSLFLGGADSVRANHASANLQGASLLIGAGLVLAGSHVFNGSAEFGTFIDSKTLIIASITTLLIIAIIAFNIDQEHIAIGHLKAVAILSSALVMLSIVIQGLITIATGSLDGLLGAVLHGLVFAGEILLYACLWMLIAGGVIGLAVLDLGIACGALIGILVITNNVLVLTVITLALAAAGLFLLGIALGATRTSIEPDRFVSAAHVSGVSTALSLDDANAVLSANLDTYAQVNGLTAREREVLGLWVTGHQDGYIAEKLCISKNTVKTHVAHIYKKTGTSNREELMRAVGV